MPQKEFDPRSNYDARAITLAAGIPQALPPARNYVVLSASVDPGAVSLSIGDNNGDPGLWPLGIEVILRDDARPPARIVSTIAQTVIVATVDGDVEIRDNRPLLLPYQSPPFRVISAGGALQTNTTLVTVANNVRGVHIIYATLACNAAAARASLGDTNNFFADAMGLQVVAVKDVVVPGGVAVIAQTTDDCRVSGCFRVL